MTGAAAQLPIPRRWPAKRREEFAAVVEALAIADSQSAQTLSAALIRSRSPSLRAALHVVNDLAMQGWCLRAGDGVVSAVAPEPADDPQTEKLRIQKQEHLKRDEQLRQPSVRRFVETMEAPREHRGAFVSIFSLMRDGRDLATKLECAHSGGSSDLLSVIDPYVQVVGDGQRCSHTGLKLMDVWRYFRHTWANQYTSTPGRTMLILVRDAAAPYHPVIGIAALGSAIVQIRERDEWIGWDPDTILTRGALTASRLPKWLESRLNEMQDRVYVEDLVEAGLFWPSLWLSPTHAAVSTLRAEAKKRRQLHERFVRRSDFRWNLDESDSWRTRAETDLFRSKRCLMLAGLLEARLDLAPLFAADSRRSEVEAALNRPRVRRAVLALVRRAKADAVGTEIADLTVCGAIAPYSALLGGKLISVLATSPTVIRAYNRRYRSYASEIASSMAGRRITRASNLAFIGTTSLYGSGSSQYNRLRIPVGTIGNAEQISFVELGRSRSFGTSHLSRETVDALVRVCEVSHNGARVNSIFGEGVNPKLRKVRQGLDALGWPSDQLLQHRRERIVYGVRLVTNLLPYLLGLERRPKYVFDARIVDDERRLAEWWCERWLSHRISADVLARVASHSPERPVHHGARVTLPPLRTD